MRKPATILAAYGLFLILVGLAGYLSNPEKAKTALLSGGVFGLISLGLGWLAHRGWRHFLPVALGIALFLGTVFTWRAAASWIAFAGGQTEKLVAAVLISSMWIATVGLIVFLIRKRKSVTG